MREKLKVLGFGALLVVVWGGGFLWVRGDLRPSAASAHPSRSASATVAPEVAAAPTDAAAAGAAAKTYTGKVSRRDERKPSGVNPALRRPAPRVLPPVATFNMATFNLLGSSHTRAGGEHAGMRTGQQRMNGALQILAQHQISVVGLQEFQPDQRAAFRNRAIGWEMYPGLSMGRRAGENSVAWRSDTWEMVKPGLIPIPYFNGHQRPMPYVLLRNKQTGVQAYFADFHNPADTGPYQHQQRYRTAATTREIGLFNQLVATGIPVFVTGDMNERAEYFCRVTGATPLKAAAGGSVGGGCRPPQPTQIDWIFGSPEVTFTGYTIDRSGLVRSTTDHPVVVTHVVLDAIKFKNAYNPSTSPTP